MKDKKTVRQDGRPPLGDRPCQEACLPCSRLGSKPRVAGEAGRSTAITLVELLAVMGIIAILAVLLIPGLTAVRKTAKETQQKAQITTIEMALTAFKNDYGDYPPSNRTRNGVLDETTGDYCGLQKLAEALVGWDLMGFHPKSYWRADGEDENGGDTTYDPDRNRDDDGDGVPDTLKERRGPYLELATANAFRLRQLYVEHGTGLLLPDTFVLCDVFGVKPVTVGGKTVKAGAPILYYRANTSSKTIEVTGFVNRIYDCLDNDHFIYNVKEMDDAGETAAPYLNPLADPANNREFFYGYITDPKVTMTPWPSRPDSYLLISAGADGLYGTRDDICNFDPNLPG